jgi:hypothetical protein
MLKTTWQVRLVQVLAIIASIDAAPPGLVFIPTIPGAHALLFIHK